MNYFLGSRREVVPNDGTTRASEQPYNQLLNGNQPLGGHLRTPPQGMLPRPQNYPNRPNNFIQGNYRENNNIVDAKTQQPLVPFGSSSSNNSVSMIVAARYGRMMMPSALPPRAPPQPQMSARNMPLSLRSSHVDSPQSYSPSSSGVIGGLQGFAKGYASGFPSSSKTALYNQKNFPYHPYEESSNRVSNNPSMFINDLNPRPWVDMNNNNFHGVNDVVLALPAPSLAPVQIKDFDHIDLTRERAMKRLVPPRPRVDMNNINFHGVKDVVLALPAPSLAPIQIKDLDHLDLTRERAMKRLVPLEIQEADDDIMKRSRMINFSSPDYCYAGVQSQKKELDLFKDDDKSASASPKIPTDIAKENDNEELDLSLHL